MKKRNFWSVLKNNIECAFCKYQKDCPMQYYPDHKLRYGARYISCEKEKQKRIKKL